MDSDSRLTMVDVAGGTVTISDRRTQSSWIVDVAPYALADRPITRVTYFEVTGKGPHAVPGAELPVESVSWFDAIQFCNALSEREGLSPAYDDRDEHVEWDRAAEGYRLPTEAEWEHACRAGTIGARYGELDDIGWYRANSGERAHEVGGKQPNTWGFYDLLGNVWEWCWDVYDPEVYGEYRVLRGGGWFDEPWSCRASVRRRSHPTFQIDDVGFRIARSGCAPS